MAIPVSELQKLNPSARIELFVLELVEGLHYATGNPSNVPTVYRFHAGSNMNSNAEIVWQGNSYQRVPITFEGAAFSGKGQIPRPTLTIANLGGITRSGSVITIHLEQHHQMSYLKRYFLLIQKHQRQDR